MLPVYDETGWPTLLLFCGFVIEWYLQVGERVAAFGAIRLEFVWGGLLALLTIFSGALGKVRNPFTPYLIVFIVSLVVQVPLSHDFPTSWEVMINRVAKFAMMALFISCFVRSPRGLRFFLGAFLLACAKMGLEGVIGQITGSMVWQNQGILRLHGSTSLYRHPNSFSGMALGTLPFVMYLWPWVSKKIKLFFLFLTGCSLTIILYTGSRTGYLGFLIMSMIFFFRSRHKGKIFFAGIILAVIIVLTLPQQYKERFESIFTSYKDTHSSAGLRVQILKDAWAIFLDHPFGVGVRAFPVVRMETFGREQDTHNFYLEVATNLGIQGFIAFFLFLYKLMFTLKKLDEEFTEQIGILEQLRGPPENSAEHTYLHSHLKDLTLMKGTAQAVYLFLWLRLGLGLFGMDLYEIYWWFALGICLVLYNMNLIARQRTVYFQGLSAESPDLSEDAVSPAVLSPVPLS